MTQITINVENEKDAEDILKSMTKYKTLLWNNDTREGQLKVDVFKKTITINQVVDKNKWMKI